MRSAILDVAAPNNSMLLFHLDAYGFVPIGNTSPFANRISKARLNAAATSALSITIKSLTRRLRPHGAFLFSQFNFPFMNLTPAPLPFSEMNSTPAASRARFMA